MLFFSSFIVTFTSIGDYFQENKKTKVNSGTFPFLYKNRLVQPPYFLVLWILLFLTFYATMNRTGESASVFFFFARLFVNFTRRPFVLPAFVCYISINFRLHRVKKITGVEVHPCDFFNSILLLFVTFCISTLFQSRCQPIQFHAGLIHGPGKLCQRDFHFPQFRRHVAGSRFKCAHQNLVLLPEAPPRTRWYLKRCPYQAQRATAIPLVDGRR